MKKFIGLILIQVVLCGSVVGQNSFESLFTGNLLPAYWVESNYVSNVIQTADGGYLFNSEAYDDFNGFYYTLLVKTDDKGIPVWEKLYSDDYDTYLTGDVVQSNDGGYIMLTQDRLFKLDSYGDSIWTKQISDFRDIELTFDDGFVVCNSDYILKFNELGDTLWSKNYGLKSIKETNDNGFIGASNSPFGTIVLKLDSIGDTLWTKSYNDIYLFTKESIQQTSDGGYIVGGVTSSFGAGGLDVAVMKLNSLGDTLWTKTYGSVNPEFFISIQQTFDDGYIIGGLTESSTSNTDKSMLIRIDPLGDTLWTKIFTYPFESYGEMSSLKQTADGGFVFIGYSKSFSIPEQRIKLVKTDPNGNICGKAPVYATIQIGTANTVISSFPINSNSSYSFPSIITIPLISNFNNNVIYNTLTFSPSICLISVDSTSTKNKVVWEKPITTAIDSFMVYREFGTGNYGIVGSVPYDSLSQFYDNTVGVDPNITSYRYKISAVDTCGNESQLSDFHETMHLSTNLAPNGDVNLIWDAYEGFPVTYYRILRDSTFTDNWEVLDSVSSNSFIWTDNNPPVNGANYVIDVIAPFSCTATKAIDHNTTRSNKGTIIAGGSAPTGDFTANFTQINIGGMVDFLDQSINNPTSWTWQFAGGSPTFSTQQNPSGITYNTAGTYDVILIVSNANGSDTLVKTNYIEVLTGGGGSVPACDFIASATQVPEGTPVDFLDLTQNNPVSWTWLFDGGNPAFSTDQSPIDIYYNTAGTYDVTLIASNGSGTDTLVKVGYIEVTSTIGVIENKDKKIKIYPNPTNSTVTVELQQIELPCTLILKDLQGRIVYSTLTNSQKLELDLSTFERGIYLIGITNNNFTRELKVVRQ